MSDAGLADPRDYVIVTHYADGDPRRLDEIACGFDGSAFDVVVASGGNGVDAGRNHEAKKPLFIVTTGALELGLVQSLSRP